MFAIETFGREHALRKEALERFIKLHQTEITHHLRPEAGVEKMKHGVFDAADVLIHRAPVVVALVDHGLVGVRRAVAHVVPGAVDKGVHRVGFTTCVGSALRALASEELFAFVERIACAVRN